MQAMRTFGKAERAETNRCAWQRFTGWTNQCGRGRYFQRQLESNVIPVLAQFQVAASNSMTLCISKEFECNILRRTGTGNSRGESPCAVRGGASNNRGHGAARKWMVFRTTAQHD